MAKNHLLYDQNKIYFLSLNTSGSHLIPVILIALSKHIFKPICVVRAVVLVMGCRDHDKMETGRTAEVCQKSKCPNNKITEWEFSTLFNTSIHNLHLNESFTSAQLVAPKKVSNMAISGADSKLQPSSISNLNFQPRSALGLSTKLLVLPIIWLKETKWLRDDCWVSKTLM